MVLLLLFIPQFSARAENTTEEKCWKVFELDHRETKDIITSVRLLKRMGKIYETYFKEASAFTPSDEDKARGFSVFIKSTGDELFPNSRPEETLAGKVLAAAGVRGEIVSLVVCVLPENDVSNSCVSVSDLAKSGGKLISKENIQIKHIKYDYVATGNSWMLKGRYLVNGPVAIPAGVTRAFRLSVKIPADAEAGEYKGKISVAAGGKSAYAVFSLEVLPFEWAELPPLHTFWIRDNSPYESGPTLEKRLEDLHAHGMNCYDSDLPVTWKIENGVLKIDYSIAEKTAPLLKKYGFTKWMITGREYIELAKSAGEVLWSPEHIKIYTALIAGFKEKAEKEGWPEIIWMADSAGFSASDQNAAVDSITLPKLYNDMLNFAGITAKAGARSNISWVSDTRTSDNSGLVPFFFYNTGRIGLCEKTMETAERLKKPLLLYNCGLNRYSFGLLVKQRNALGNSMPYYCAAKYGNPTTPGASISCVVTGPDSSLIDTYAWEQAGEGVNDFRYIWTLEHALAGCREPASPGAAAARAALDAVSKVTFTGADIKTLSPDPFAAEMTDFKGSRLDKVRTDIIECIMALKKQ